MIVESEQFLRRHSTEVCGMPGKWFQVREQCDQRRQCGNELWSLTGKDTGLITEGTKVGK